MSALRPSSRLGPHLAINSPTSMAKRKIPSGRSNHRHSSWLNFRRQIAGLGIKPIARSRSVDSRKLLTCSKIAGELLLLFAEHAPRALSPWLEHHHCERVKRVGETGFALNQKLHDLITHAYLFRTLLFAAEAYVFSNPPARPIHVRSYIRLIFTISIQRSAHSSVLLNPLGGTGL